MSRRARPLPGHRPSYLHRKPRRKKSFRSTDRPRTRCRAPDSRLRNSVRTQHHSKAEAPVSGVGETLAPIGAARDAANVAERPAARDPRDVVACGGILAFRVVRIVGIPEVGPPRIRSPEAPSPFPDVADHVVKAKTVGRETADRRCISDPGVAVVRPFGVGPIAPREVRWATQRASRAPAQGGVRPVTGSGSPLRSRRWDSRSRPEAVTGLHDQEWRSIHWSAREASHDDGPCVLAMLNDPAVA